MRLSRLAEPELHVICAPIVAAKAHDGSNGIYVFEKLARPPEMLLHKNGGVSQECRRPLLNRELSQEDATPEDAVQFGPDRRPLHTASSGF